MYRLAPAFSPDFDVKPQDVMYRLAPYHQFNTSESSPSSNEQTTIDPVAELEKQQLDLIERLKKQSESLKKLLENATPAAVSASSSSSKDVKGDNKKMDKDAKKEARKAARNEAKNKVAGNNEKPKDGGKLCAWNVEDDRKTWETGLSLTANIPVNLVQYPQESCEKLEITYTANDEKWMQILSKIAVNRGVAFNGTIDNQSKNAKNVVKTSKGDVFGMNVNGVQIKCRQTAWKTLGQMLGLYSRKAEQTLNASHQSRWFLKADDIFNNVGSLDYTERECSQFLARFDSLSSQWEITMADIILMSLLNRDNKSLPNNVELWISKVNTLLQ